MPSLRQSSETERAASRGIGRPGSSGCLPRLLLACLALLAAQHVWPSSARALTFTCVESSKYKYLAPLYGGDMGKLSTALGGEADRPPPPEACRAALVNGGVVPGDYGRLIDIVAANAGWLDTLYLDSGGGNVKAGTESAVLIRQLWLATQVPPPGAQFNYGPDFLYHAGLGGSPGAGKFLADEARLGQTGNPRPFCASACTFLLAAGADRSGIAYLHRCGTGGDDIQTVEMTVDGCLSISRKLYEVMGTSDAFAETMLSTPKQNLTPVRMPRFPPPVEDALLERCKSDGAQLDDLTSLLSYDAGSTAIMDTLGAASPLADVRSKVDARQRETERCITQLRGKDRLAAFQRLCDGGCQRQKLDQLVASKIKQLAP